MDFEEMFGCARDAPTLLNYWPTSKFKGLGLSWGIILGTKIHKKVNLKFNQNCDGF